MTEPERIKRLEEQITLAGLLPGINLDCLPPEESCLTFTGSAMRAVSRPAPSMRGTRSTTTYNLNTTIHKFNCWRAGSPRECARTGGSSKRCFARSAQQFSEISGHAVFQLKR
jgi:hypothetical protein